MKIYLDLLPEERKKEIRRKNIFSVIVSQEIISLAPILFLVFVLISINLIIQFKIKSTEQLTAMHQTTKENQELKKYEDKFSAINSKISAVSRFQSSHFYWSNVLGRLSSLSPDGVYLTDLSTKDYTVSIAGKALVRDELLKFQDNIKNNDCFANVNTPLSNLVTRDNVAFQIDFDIKSECLKNPS